MKWKTFTADQRIHFVQNNTHRILHKKEISLHRPS